MARYKNLGGGHSLPDNKLIKNGEHFESDDVDLMKKFPNKFEKVSGGTVGAPAAPKAPAPAAPATPPLAVEVPEDDTGAKETAEDAPASGAEDVSKDFQEAGENELTVKRDKAGYWVMDDSDPVNEKALRSKKAVEKTIADYVKG